MEDADSWCLRFEGSGQGIEDARHWVRVYDDLIRTVRNIAGESGNPEAARTLLLLQRRRAHWNRKFREAVEAGADASTA